MEEKTIKDFKDFSGIDISLEESLFMYGFVWKQLSQDKYLFVYRLCIDKDGNHVFCKSEFSITDFEDILNSSWFKMDNLLSILGLDKETWENCSFPQKVSDLVSGYGIDNIFGCDYENGFIIKVNFQGKE
jgi:hypothetical protein